MLYLMVLITELFTKYVNYFMWQVLQQRLDENALDSALSWFTMQAFVNMVMNLEFNKGKTYSGLP
jgi:hypothetical protein